MTLNSKLIDWNLKWRLNQGYVICRACDGKQVEDDRELAFNHLISCRYAHEHTQPWQELDKIIDGLQRRS